jgi:O-antigen/teichoic acid export membrane protein
MGLSFASAPLIARTLGPTQYGELSFVLANYLILEAVSQLGLQNIFKKEVLKNQGQANIIFINTLITRLLSAVFVTVIFIFFAHELSSDAPMRSLFYLFSGILFLRSFDVIEWYLEAKLDLTKLNRFKILFVGIVFLVRLYGVYKDFQILFFAFTYLLEALFILSFYIVQFRKLITKLEYSIVMIIDFLKRSWHLIFSTLAITLYMKIDQLMIHEILDATELGNYSASVKISELFNFIPMTLSTLLLPLWFKGEGNKSEIIKKSFSMVTLPSVIISLSIYIFSPVIIDIIYGSSFTKSSSILRVHIFSLIFVFIGVFVSNYEVYTQNTKHTLRRTIFGAVINILLNLILIPTHGVIGAALSTLISYGLSLVLYNIVYKEFWPLNLLILKSFSPLLFIETLKGLTKKSHE